MKKYKVLYVDDEDINILLFNATFGNNYILYTSDSGKNGLNILKNNIE